MTRKRRNLDASTVPSTDADGHGYSNSDSDGNGHSDAYRPPTNTRQLSRHINAAGRQYDGYA